MTRADRKKISRKLSMRETSIVKIQEKESERAGDCTRGPPSAKKTNRRHPRRVGAYLENF